MSSPRHFVKLRNAVEMMLNCGAGWREAFHASRRSVYCLKMPQARLLKRAHRVRALTRNSDSANLTAQVEIVRGGFPILQWADGSFAYLADRSALEPISDI